MKGGHLGESEFSSKINGHPVEGGGKSGGNHMVSFFLKDCMALCREQIGTQQK